MESEHCVPLYEMSRMQHDLTTSAQWDLISQQCREYMEEPEAASNILSNSSVFQSLSDSVLVEVSI